MKLKCEKSDLCRTFHSPLKCSLIRVSKSPETLFRADMFPACLLGGSTDTVDEGRRKKKKKSRLVEKIVLYVISLNIKRVMRAESGNNPATFALFIKSAPQLLDRNGRFLGVAPA